MSQLPVGMRSVPDLCSRNLQLGKYLSLLTQLSDVRNSGARYGRLGPGAAPT